MGVEAIRQHTLIGFELLGIAAFALSGVISAVRKRMDVVGICACGFLAAFGGGTLRDLLIDRRPFFWVEHQLVLMGVLMLCVACATFLRRHDLMHSEKWLQIPDAIGLALFCTTGLHLSWTLGQPPAVAVMMASACSSGDDDDDAGRGETIVLAQQAVEPGDAHVIQAVERRTGGIGVPHRRLHPLDPAALLVDGDQQAVAPVDRAQGIGQRA